MSDFVVSKLNSMSLKIVPIMMILYSLFSIYSSFMGSLLYSELGTSARFQSWNKSKLSTLRLHMGLSVIVLIISILFLRSVW
jgi:hypothetical protein